MANPWFTAVFQRFTGYIVHFAKNYYLLIITVDKFDLEIIL